jgi:MoaA/NifB/PqqE/SkfB family radical SAM enzyme
MSWREPVLAGLRDGRPRVGPSSVHIDVTNACNAACVTCWDHSPLLTTPRPASWKKRRLSVERFGAIVDQLEAMRSVRHVVLSGMGDPLVHPDIYALIARVKAAGWEVTMITNLLAADPDKLCAAGVDQLLVGVQGVTPDTYAAFHPGWTEKQFFELCALLRRLAQTSTRVRHVQVINRDTAPEVVQMVQFARSFGADRVNYKLAALSGGTESTAITEDQRAWLLSEGIPAAREAAARLGVRTNLDLFQRQVEAGGLATAPMSEIGCAMGYVFTRITVDEEVLFCCNTAVRVGSLAETGFAALWYGERWQALRDQLRAGQWFEGCDRCGKLEQNVKWAALARGGTAEHHELVGTSS